MEGWTSARDPCALLRAHVLNRHARSRDGPNEATVLGGGPAKDSFPTGSVPSDNGPSALVCQRSASPSRGSNDVIASYSRPPESCITDRLFVPGRPKSASF